jgi:hypothetical protein
MRIKRLAVVTLLLLGSWAVFFLAVYGAMRLWEKFYVGG